MTATRGQTNATRPRTSAKCSRTDGIKPRTCGIAQPRNVSGERTNAIELPTNAGDPVQPAHPSRRLYRFHRVFLSAMVPSGIVLKPECRWKQRARSGTRTPLGSSGSIRPIRVSPGQTHNAGVRPVLVMPYPGQSANACDHVVIAL